MNPKMNSVCITRAEGTLKQANHTKYNKTEINPKCKIQPAILQFIVYKLVDVFTKKI